MPSQPHVFVVRRNQRVGSTKRIGRVARPPIGIGPAHHASPNWIELDIPIAGQHIIFTLCQARPKSPLPQGSAPAVCPVDVLHVALTQVLHQQRGAVLRSRCQQQVDMVGHQNICMHGAIEAPRQFLQALKIKTIVLLGEETRRAVIAALDDVPGHAGKV